MITYQLKSSQEQFVVRVALVRYKHWLNEQIEFIETSVEEDLKENALKSKQVNLKIVKDLLLKF